MNTFLVGCGIILIVVLLEDKILYLFAKAIVIKRKSKYQNMSISEEYY
jgi:hypothetical protein